jgi:hypothetical protein
VHLLHFWVGRVRLVAGFWSASVAGWAAKGEQIAVNQGGFVIGPRSSSSCRWRHRIAPSVTEGNGYIRRRLSAKTLLALGLAVVALSAIALGVMPVNHTRQLAQRFVGAMQPDSSVPATTYLAPDAAVFLEGASTAASPAQFQTYIDQLKRGKRAFTPVSPLYLNESGAGWLTQIKYFGDDQNLEIADSPLWMDVIIAGDQVTELWVNFTVEGLAPHHVPRALYAQAAQARGTPVPEAWSSGTDAMLSAAARVDQAISRRGWVAGARGLLLIPLAAGLALTAISSCVIVGRARGGHRQTRAVRSWRGAEETAGSTICRLAATRASLNRRTVVAAFRNSGLEPDVHFKPDEFGRAKSHLATPPVPTTACAITASGSTEQMSRTADVGS